MLLLPVTSGCYLSHVAAGQLRLLSARRPIAEVVADPATSAELRDQLDLVERTRAYATSLGLEVGGQYTSYAPWAGDRVVTAVVASVPGKVEPKGFWFPIVGTVPYKGFFSLARAEHEAEGLRAEGDDVCLVPVAAYSTLGWFDDPVTGPMLRIGTGRLVETLLHELVHATVYLPDDADFSEGVATFIGEEASVAFYRDSGDEAAASRRREEVREQRRIDAVRLALRDEVAALYAGAPAGPEREAERAALEAGTRAEIAGLPLRIRDPVWLSEALPLNDACLAIAATYTADLERYEALFETLGGDLHAFVARLREAAESDDPRAALLGP